MRTLACLAALGLTLTGCTDDTTPPPPPRHDMAQSGPVGNQGDMAQPGQSTDMAQPAAGDDMAKSAPTDDMAQTTPGVDMALGNDMTPPPPCLYDGAPDGTAKLLAIFTLPPMSLKNIDPYLTDAQLATALTNGAKTTDQVSLGSGLDYAGGCPGSFYGIGDRGINDKVKGDKNGVAFPLPAYTPMIAKVTAQADGSLSLDKSLPIYAAADTPATGISNTTVDETPYVGTAKGSATLPLDPNGLDPEDVRRLPNGDFLICEEYSPSVALIDGTTGVVKARYVPQTKNLTGTSYPVREIFPAVFLKRRANKGFEGLAVSSDGHTGWVFLQAPMGDTSLAQYDNSLVNRLVRVDHIDDPANAVASAEYVVNHAPVTEFPLETAQDSVYFNSATWLADGKLLAIERAKGRLTLVVIDVTGATDLLQHPEYEAKLDPEDTGVGLATLGIIPAGKTLVFDSDDTPTFIKSPPNGAVSPSKLEGVAIINSATVAIANDNDFGISDATDNSRIWIIRLKQTLPQ